jgi:hypothetical protein
MSPRLPYATGLLLAWLVVFLLLGGTAYFAYSMANLMPEISDPTGRG